MVDNRCEVNSGLIVIKIDFDDSKPQHSMECGYGLPMIYGSFNHNFSHGRQRFSIPDVPAWVCPEVCIGKSLKGCSGSLQLLEGPVGDRIIKAVDPYYKKS